MPRPTPSAVERTRVLVTGASGMLGKALLKELQPAFEGLGVSRRQTPGVLTCDLSDAKQVQEVFKGVKPGLVIHSAAYSDVDGCERDPQQAHMSNVVASKNLSEACDAARVPWIYVSTDYVFDGRKTTPYTEKDKTGPVNIYGLTKLGGECYAMTSRVSCASVRTSWLFGPDNPANFVNAILARLKKEKKVSVLNDQTDSPTSVKDLSQALIRIGQHLMDLHEKDPGSANHEIFHLCNKGGTTRHEMTVRMKEWLHLKDVEVEVADHSQIKNRLAIRPAYVVMNTDHYENFFKTTLRPWQESLKEYVMSAV